MENGSNLEAREYTELVNENTNGEDITEVNAVELIAIELGILPS